MFQLPDLLARFLDRGILIEFRQSRSFARGFAGEDFVCGREVGDGGDGVGGAVGGRLVGLTHEFCFVLEGRGFGKEFCDFRFRGPGLVLGSGETGDVWFV